MVLILPRRGRSAQQVYPYSTLLVKHRCALKVHFNNDRCGKGVNVHLGLEVYQKGTTPRSRCTLLLALVCLTYRYRGRGTIEFALDDLLFLYVQLNPFMPAGTYMYRQGAKNSNFSDFDDTWQN